MAVEGNRGRLWVISAPSGAGKTTLVRTLVKRVPDLVVSISHTTRPRRPSEEDGVDYHFVDDARFVEMIEAGDFLEHARVFDYRYGTSRAWVERETGAGRDVILEIDWQGARQVRNLVSGTPGIFILPPSFATLEQRLAGRGDDDAVIRRRMREAAQEISHFDEYEYHVVNDAFEPALARLEAIITGLRQGNPAPPDPHGTLAKDLLEQAREIK